MSATALTITAAPRGDNPMGQATFAPPEPPRAPVRPLSNRPSIAQLPVPDDTLAHAFSFLSPGPVARATRVSKQFRRATELSWPTVAGRLFILEAFCKFAQAAPNTAFDPEKLEKEISPERLYELGVAYAHQYFGQDLIEAVGGIRNYAMFTSWQSLFLNGFIPSPQGDSRVNRSIRGPTNQLVLAFAVRPREILTHNEQHSQIAGRISRNATGQLVVQTEKFSSYPNERGHAVALVPQIFPPNSTENQIVDRLRELFRGTHPIAVLEAFDNEIDMRVSRRMASHLDETQDKALKTRKIRTLVIEYLSPFDQQTRETYGRPDA